MAELLNRRGFLWVWSLLTVVGIVKTAPMATAAPKTCQANNIDKWRMFNQAMQNITGLQLDMRRNAITWKGMARAQNPPLETLRTYMHDAAKAYQTRLAWVTAGRSKVSGILASVGFSENDITDKVSPMTTVANRLSAERLSSYAEVVVGCDYILETIEAPESLWPE